MIRYPLALKHITKILPIYILPIYLKSINALMYVCIIVDNIRAYLFTYLQDYRIASNYQLTKLRSSYIVFYDKNIIKKSNVKIKIFVLDNLFEMTMQA